jgi:hypothetical protein
MATKLPKLFVQFCPIFTKLPELDGSEVPSFRQKDDDTAGEHRRPVTNTGVAQLL